MAELSTYSDIVDLVYAMIGDDATNQRLATTDQIDTWANARLYELGEYAEYRDYVASTTGAVGSSISVSFTDGEPVYGAWRVEVDNEAIYPTTTKHLYRGSRTWQDDTGEPYMYYLDSLQSITTDAYKVGLYPSATSSYTFRIYMTVAGEALSYADKADNVTLPAWATPAIVWGVLASYYEHAGRKMNRGTAALYQRMFDDAKARLRQRTFSKTRESKAWGQGRTYTPGSDWRMLIPSTGITEP